MKNTKAYDHQQSSGLHRQRTLYFIRHGEALHNVREAQAQQQANAEAKTLHLSPEETRLKMEAARQAVLLDASLRDAPLTELGRQQARECGKKLQALIDQGTIHPPTEAMVSPLTRTLQTCHIILDTLQPDIKAHIREELQERQTQYPPDTAKSRRSIFQYSQANDRFLMDHIETETLSKKDTDEEAKIRESKEMLRERAAMLFDLVMQMDHRHIMIVGHKGYLRELERGLLGLEDSPLFGNAELRVYQVCFTRGERSLDSIDRVV